MTDDAQWEARVAGAECPLCAPRPDSSEHWDLIATLSVASLYLAKNQTYRGQCVLIFDLRHAARPDQLSAEEWAALSRDLFAAQAAVVRVVRPDHINIESLGNAVPHLHWHIVPRYVHDPRWGAPIWTSALPDMVDTRIPHEERKTLIEEIRKAIE